MLLIPDNTTLRRFIPNTFTQTFPDQETLYDKIQPHLTAAELWLTETLIPHDLLHRIVEEASNSGDPLYFVPRSIVALKEWIDAVPSLDVVVSDNGISTVETSTLRPASKAKIDRLMDTSREQLDQALRLLPGLLEGLSGWHHSRQSEPFRSTLFHDYAVLDSLTATADNGGNIHDRFTAVLPRLKAIEDEISRYWVSVPVMDRLRSCSRKCMSPNESRLLDLTRTAVVSIANGTDPVHKKMLLRGLADYVISHPEDFPEWRGTHTAALFSVRAYQNKPGSPAHWL